MSGAAPALDSWGLAGSFRGFSNPSSFSRNSQTNTPIECLRKSTAAQQTKDVLRSRRLAGPPQVNDKCGLSLGNRVPWRERYQLSVTEATGSVVTELVCVSGSERRGQFCSQHSEYCRSRDRWPKETLSACGALDLDQVCCSRAAATLSAPCRPSNESAPLRTLRQLLSGADIVQLAIRLGLLALLIYWTLVILSPFLPILAWSVVLTVAFYPVFRWLAKSLGGRPKLAAATLTIINLGILIGPATWLGLRAVEGVREFA